MRKRLHPFLTRQRNLMVANEERKVVAAPDPDLPDPLRQRFR